MEACWSRFTAAEGGARLAATASLKNTLAVEHSSFIAVRLLYEKAYQIRGLLFDDRKRSVYITRATRVPVVGFELKILTDLSVIEATEYSDVYDWCAELDSKEVIVCTAAILKQILAEELLSMVNINVLVIDSCHMVYEDDNLKYIMQQYKQCNNNNRPIILALTYPLFSLNTKDNEKLKDISQLKPCSESKETSIIKKNEKELIEDDENPDVEAIENTQVIKQSHTTTINSKSFEEHSQFKRIIEIDANGEIEDLKCQEILERDSKSQVEDLKCTEIAAKNSCTDFKCQEISSKNYHSGDLNSKLIGNVSSSVKELQCNDNTVSETNVHDKITQIALTDDKVNEEDITADANVIEDKFEQLALNDGKINDEDIQCKNKTENTDKIDDKFIQIALIEDKDNEKESLVTEKNDENFKVDNNQIHIGVYENLDDFDMYEKLEWKIEELENELCCQMDLAEDIDGGKRLSTSITKPRELIIEYSGRPTNDKLSQEYLDLEKYMRDTIADAMIFINDHRHDPSEIYGEELFEEFMNIPDPTIEPKHILNQFLYVLDQLGPYAADKAAFSLLTKLEKLKIKVPYERHFLLLCLCTTVFVKIRCYADEVFNKYSTDWERIQTFCTPKVLRFAEILETFQPPETKADDDNSTNHTNDNDISIKDNIDSDVNVSHDIIENEIDENRRIFETNNFYDGSSISCTTNVDSKSVIVETSGNLNVNIDINGTDIKLGKMCDDAIVVDTNNVDDASLSGDICGNDIKMNTVTKETLAVDASKMLDELDKCDFNTLGDKIQDRVNIYEANLKDIDDITDDLYINQNCINLDINNEDNKNIVIKIKDTQGISDDIEKVELCDVKDNENGNIEVTNKQEPQKLLGARRRTGHRVRGSRGRGVASARTQQLQLNPDALCAVVYLHDPLLAKIMFMLVVDMSRCNPRLSYLCAQYCATEQPADPGTEPKECQRQGKKQEEVLKKFRMHECNLLLATSELEEGIDLPRCNLVLRWDLPPSYRSYGACRSRARALRSAAALLCTHDAATTDLLLHNLATYRELDQMISRKCGCGMQDEPPQSEEDHADTFTAIIKPYTPNDAVNPFKNSSDISKTSQDISKINTDTENIDPMLLNGFNLDIESESEIKVNTNNLGLCSADSEVKCIVNIKDTEEDNKLEIAKHDYNKFNNLYIYDKRTDNSLHYNENNDNSELSTCITNSVLDNTEQNKETVDNNIFNENIPKTHTDKIVKENPVNKTSISERDIRDIKTNVNCYNKCDAKSSDNECVSDIINVSRCDIVSKSHSETKGDSKENVNDNENAASVDLSNAIALINRYCGKLPSDTFTRLTPQWWLEEVQLPVSGSAETRTAYICTLRLPLNCPVKYNIVGHPMPTKVLARRMVALQACRILHKSGELDDQLMPIGKENFKAAEMEGAGVGSGDSEAGESARPGTTKRRQYYYKRTALAFTDCQPVEDTSDSEIDPPGDRPRPEARPKLKDTKPGVKRNMLYAIVSRLWCALPERYNTRGRRLHAPQSARQAIGLLMARAEPDNLQIPAFPVYTRSGEVRVSVEHVPDADVRLSPRRGRLVRRFMRFVFSEVLRVRRRGMKLQSEGSTHNNYYIVPTVKSTREDGTTKIDIDWPFLELIYQHTEEKKQLELEMPIPWNQDGKDEGGNAEIEKETKFRRRDGRVKKMENPLLKPGETFVFDAEKYREAVVTPWYRNQDQPQFFLVAEICWNLTPDSAFPSTTHGSFRDYYTNKYGVTLTQKDQPLLDVDHTSARLNLLTPRYVNRKGVALPVSSERTRRAKRDRLDQKQILVPELCRVHPFAAPLWFATVALPCVLYRINALLIADEIRRAVAIDVGLGIPKITEETRPGFHWPPLDFGWSLADVLSADSEKNEKKKEEDETKMNQNELEGKEEKEIERDTTEGKKAKTVNDILQEKEGADNCFEIGTWSNDMASSIPLNDDYDEYMEPLPPNLTFCTSASGGTDWCQPIEKPKCQFNPSRSYSMADSDCSFISSDLDSDDSDLEFDGSEDEDTDTSGFYSSKNANAAMGVRIEYKTAHEAEAFDLERNKKVNPAPLPDPEDDLEDRAAYERLIRTGKSPEARIQQFRDAVTKHKVDIIANGHLITKDQKITQILPETKGQKRSYQQKTLADRDLTELFPYGHEGLTFINGKVDVASVERNKRELLHKFKTSLPNDVIKSLNCFSMVDIDIDSPEYVNERISNVGFDKKDKYEDLNDDVEKETKRGSGFEFDYQPALRGHPGPTPSLILQALTMSNANDGMNLERLETIGDSFLKFAITAYLYCAHPTVHEGKLSHMRSKQVSNLNLYRLGRSKRLGARMIASKFEPHDNWLPPCHKPPHTQHHAYATDSKELGSNGDAQLDASGCFIPYNLITQHSIPDKSIADCVEALIGAYLLECGPRGALLFMAWLGIRVLPAHRIPLPPDHPAIRQLPTAQKPSPAPSPRRHRTSSSSSSSTSSSSCSSDEEQQSQQDHYPESDWSWPGRPVGSLRPFKDENGQWVLLVFGELKAPPSPLLRYIEDPEGELERMLSGYEELERTLQYRFKDRSLLLQALTHASHQSNRLTDCYQRLEFLGDAILDYLITRHLYEDPRRHSPGALTDLRSALVNNTIFATLAARHGFHKYFRHMSPGLNEVLTKYVKIQEENGHSISEEHYLIQEDEMEQAEDVEVPKALGDLFESVAGAIFLDSGMSLDAVWKSYVNLMGAELEAFSAAAPKSPVRELLEAEPDTAKFGKPERLADGRRVRVCVEVFGRGAFKGVGRNYRIAKGTAARCALRHLRATRTR